MLAQNCENHYKKSCIKLSCIRNSQKIFSNCFQFAMKSKRDWRFYYISFWIRHPLWVFWTEIPILSIKLFMHLTLKETKLKLKLQRQIKRFTNIFTSGLF